MCNIYDLCRPTEIAYSYTTWNERPISVGYTGVAGDDPNFGVYPHKLRSAVKFHPSQGRPLTYISMNVADYDHPLGLLFHSCYRKPWLSSSTYASGPHRLHGGTHIVVDVKYGIPICLDFRGTYSRS